MNSQADTSPIGMKPKLQDYTPEEQDILRMMMRDTGKPLEELNVSLILKQARAMGDL